MYVCSIYTYISYVHVVTKSTNDVLKCHKKRERKFVCTFLTAPVKRHVHIKEKETNFNIMKNVYVEKKFFAIFR